MTGYVVDAGVAVKWLVQEAFSQEAGRMLDASLTLVAPELLFAEVTNALWAMQRRGDIVARDYAEAVDLLSALPIVIPSSMRELAASAGRLATDLDHPVYDCFYLALAFQQQYPVVTADRRFVTKVQGHPYLTGHVRHIADLG